MAEHMLEVRGLSVHLGGSAVLKDVDLQVPKGRFVALVGPNGSGKTTLLRALYRGVQPSAGALLIEGRPVDQLTQRALGRALAVLRQETALAFDFLVTELVLLGRSPYKKLFDLDRPKDHEIVEDALRMTGATQLANRRFSTLSGGEKQRVLLARALAQRPSLLVLDEPSNHLDIKHRLEILSLIKRSGLSVLAALHDLNLAQTFADLIFVLEDGRIVERGPPSQVLQPQLIERVFGVASQRLETDLGEPVLAFDTL